MIAYYTPRQDLETGPKRSALSRDLFHGLTPEQFERIIPREESIAGINSTTRHNRFPKFRP